MAKPTRRQLVSALEHAWQELTEISGNIEIPVSIRLQARSVALRIEPLLFWEASNLPNAK